MGVARYAKKLQLRMIEDKTKPIDGIDLEDSDQVAEYFWKMIGESPNEQFAIITVNGAVEYIGEAIVNAGNAMASIVDVACVIRTILLCGGEGVFVAHNHPSGHTQASSPDIQMTLNLVSTCRLLGIMVLDHLIIGGEDDYYSFRAEKPEFWNV